MMKSHEWRKIGERKGRLYFFYEKSVLDLTTFADQHPGGRKALANYAGKDITNVIFTVYPHNQQNTLHTLMRYEIGQIPTEEVTMRSEKKTTLKSKNCLGKSSNEDQDSIDQLKTKKQVTFSPKLSKNGVELSTSTSKAPQNVTKTHQSKIILQESSSNSQQVIKKNVNQEVSQRSVKLEVRRSSDEIDENKPEFKVPVMLVKQKQFQGTPV